MTEQQQELLINNIRGVCGCTDDELQEDILKVIYHLYNNKDEHGNRYITDIVESLKMDYNYVLAILTILDASDLIEHGSSIRGSWLTGKGEILSEELVFAGTKARKEGDTNEKDTQEN